MIDSAVEEGFKDLEVELVKKPGKGLGLSLVGRRDGAGVFVSDIVSRSFVNRHSRTSIRFEISRGLA